LGKLDLERGNPSPFPPSHPPPEPPNYSENNLIKTPGAKSSAKERSAFPYTAGASFYESHLTKYSSIEFFLRQ